MLNPRRHTPRQVVVVSSRFAPVVGDPVEFNGGLARFNQGRIAMEMAFDELKVMPPQPYSNIGSRYQYWKLRVLPT